ncbi:YjbF family lipoprotein [Halomonas sp. C05BenzN]|uniref:YjbF family lipoprotein n=1 Tax=Halomonas sp. C05BenzN TaxID=3411041 RepID=UPI003B9497C3
MDHDTRLNRPREHCQGRRRAALACHCLPLVLALGLGGCVQGGGLTPMGESLVAPWRGSDAAARAAALPYASLAMTSDGNEALMVMAHRSGDSGRDTYWQAGDRATLHLRDGLPMTSAGFEATLLGQWREASDASGRYRLHAHWRDGDGTEHRATASVSLACDAPRPRALPLTTLALEPCTEHLHWPDGKRTTNRLWRDPDSRRVWAGDVTAWPGGQRLRWQVARPWWTDAEDIASRTTPDETPD